MKNKALTLVFALFAITLSVITPSQANAGDCSAGDPCQTWAMLDESGVVINIIVCQPSVCGSGVWDGRKVVLQVPANPTTHKPQGGYYNPIPNPGEVDRTVTYNSEEKTFTQEGATWSAPHTNTAIVDSTTLTAEINPDGSKETNAATISATQGELTDSKSFAQSVTAAQFEEYIKNTFMLKKHLNKFFELLKGWIIN